MGKSRQTAAFLVLFGALLVVAFVVDASFKATQAFAETAVLPSFEGESMTFGTFARIDAKADASGGYALRYEDAGTAKKQVTTTQDATQVVVRARRSSVSTGRVYIRLYVDGVQQGSDMWLNQDNSWSEQAFSVSLPAGTHKIGVKGGSLRETDALYVDTIRLVNPTAPPTASSENPFAGEKFYVDPNSKARKTADAWNAKGRTADAKAMEKIAKSPSDPYYMAEWTERYDGIEFYTRHFIGVYQQAGAVPTLGLYAIPNRDCGSYSGGGFSTAAEYKAWIDKARAGSGSEKVIWILEPDAVPYWECLSDDQIQQRVELLRYAIDKLSENPNAYVYIDAGHSGWHTPQTIIDRLNRIGIQNAAGFTTNISNFNYTDKEVAWAKQVSAGVGNKPFVVDTSRNGSGPYTGGTHDGGCPPQINPPGRALGIRPTANTGDPLIHAFFWLKQPGESDGACGSFPGAGQWMPGYALGLAKRASY